MTPPTDELELIQHADQPSLAGFLVTWSNGSDPETYQRALEMWSAHPAAFGAALSDRRVRPGHPPSYPRR
jgi:hypothetical protein